MEAAVGSIFFNQGESCNAPSRLFVEESIKDAFLEKALKLVPGYQPGNPLDRKHGDGCDRRPGAARQRVRYITLGEQRGAKLLRVVRCASPVGGCYVQPTIFDG